MLYAKLIAMAAGAGTLGLSAIAQAAAGEDLSVALEHSAAGGAFATIAVYLILKGRMDGHGKDIKALRDDHVVLRESVGKIDEKMSSIAEDVSFMAGRERGRMDGQVRTRRDDSVA